MTRLYVVRLLVLLVALTALPGLAAPTTTFGSVIGPALLCTSEIDTAYFESYLTQAFGPPYKHEGNAYWFKADALLWGAPVLEVFVSDTQSPLRFIGATFDMTPEALADSIAASIQIRFHVSGKQRYPVRLSKTGSSLIYFNNKSKVFCAKSKFLMTD